MDEIALALTADAFSRTYRSRAVAIAESAGPVKTLDGLTLLPDHVTGEHGLPRHRHPAFEGPSTLALDQALADIEDMYGRRTSRFVALQLEYPRGRP